jgi:hypothetical protein
MSTEFSVQSIAFSEMRSVPTLRLTYKRVGVAITDCEIIEPSDRAFEKGAIQ